MTFKAPIFLVSVLTFIVSVSPDANAQIFGRRIRQAPVQRTGVQSRWHQSQSQFQNSSQFQQPRERPLLKALATGLEIYSTTLKHKTQMEMLQQQQRMQQQAIAQRNAQMQMQFNHQKRLNDQRYRQILAQQQAQLRQQTNHNRNAKANRRGNRVDWYGVANASGSLGQQAAAIHRVGKPILDQIHRKTGYKQPKQFDKIAKTFGW